MNNEIMSGLEILSRKIVQNTASLDDYRQYETLLLNGGLSHNYIFSYLNQAGFKTWEDFVAARHKKEHDKDIEAAVVGGLVGLGLGLLIIGLFSTNKN